MLCYRDRAWCSQSALCKASCYRRATDEDLQAAKERNLGISYMNFRGLAECPGFEPKEVET